MYSVLTQFAELFVFHISICTAEEDRVLIFNIIYKCATMSRQEFRHTIDELRVCYLFIKIKRNS